MAMLLVRLPFLLFVLGYAEDIGEADDTALLSFRGVRDSSVQPATGSNNALSLLTGDDDPVEAPPKRDVYGCSCGPNSQSPGKGCCSGKFNAEGNNCISDESVTCSSASGKSLCCKDEIHAWCCPAGTSCLQQKPGKWNSSACTNPQPTTLASVHTSWSIAGGGPGAPAGMKIEFKAGITQKLSHTQTNDVKNALTMGYSFAGFKLSDTFTSEWNTVVASSLTVTESFSCSLECPTNYYLWVFRTSIDGIDTLPPSYQNLFASCSAVVCSPYGLEKPPACPFGYQDDPEGGFGCCTSMEWLSKSSATGATRCQQGQYCPDGSLCPDCGSDSGHCDCPADPNKPPSVCPKSA